VIVAALNERRLEYALCGGLAMAVHGFVRATVDIDLFVPAGQVGAIEDAVADLGYGDTMILDLLLVTPETESIWSTP